ncbi:helix-turn-helix domain-containing protein [Streptomyces phaeochromogenes]|uniref:helix-turn-helix transcriptional regulator n=1 Tax=Streptomyces phaeochromogenes TaxID=1923 RepID=UPI002E27C0DC|nr:helix-turn-helix domain-containing protein [Streptomyces phaeochromogenes]
MSSKPLTTAEAADYIGVAPRTLDNWRVKSTKLGRLVGPRWVKSGRNVRYRAAELDRWLKSREIGDDVIPPPTYSHSPPDRAKTATTGWRGRRVSTSRT